MRCAVAFALLASLAAASPVRRWAYSQYFDLQGHRGGRGETIENTLPSFAQGLINGVTSLEMDVGITKDGEAVVWHDENIDPTKCRDTGAVVANDPMYPYVGKYIANLTLAQLQTLDCGSLRLTSFPLQEVVPGTKLATLREMFDFVECATDNPVLFNIETKVDGDFHNYTRSPEDFVNVMGGIFEERGADVVDRITLQSFDWRTLVLSKQLFPSLRTSALFDDSTLYKNPDDGSYGTILKHGEGPSNWLAGIDIDTFEGATIAERVARAAASIKADFISPVTTSYASTGADAGIPGWIPFVNKTMVDTAHELGMQVKPWTSNTKNVLSYLLEAGIDGVITDFPHEFRRELELRGYPLAPKADEARVMGCLAKFNQLTSDKLDGSGYA